MPVDNFLELAMTTLGWHLYSLVWAIFVETGLVYLPIISMIIRNYLDPVESQDAKSAAVTSLRRTEIDIIIMMAVIFFAATPSIDLAFHDSAKSAGSESQKQHMASTLNGSIVQVPLVFYGAMQIAGGINAAFAASLPDQITVRQLRMSASTARITDLPTKREVGYFIDECYSKAKYQYMRNNEARINADVREDEWIGWVGNKRFLENEYTQLWASQPIKHWDFNTAPGSADAAHETSEHGRPRCDKWWLDQPNGLMARLVEQYPPSAMEKMKGLFSSKEEINDAAVRKLLQNEAEAIGQLELTSNVNFASGRSVSLGDLASLSFLGDVGAGVIEWGSGAILAILANMAIDFVIMAAPYAQAFTLFGIYFLLPIIIVIGGFQVSTIKTAVIVIFIVKFWTSIWLVVALVDDQLAYMLTVRDGVHPIDFISLMVGFDGIIINLTIFGLYVSLPAASLMMLAWSGESSANSSSGVTGSATGAGTAAGSASSSTAKGIGSKMKG